MLFSIITCTYNPNVAIFKRLIKAITMLNYSEDFCFEWLIVDNNSKVSVSDLLIFKEVLNKNINFHIIEEYKPGLTNARIKGVQCAKGEWIIFFDDDNEPDQDYLIRAYNLINIYPFVKCWGPGSINVTFIDPKVKFWISSRKDMFQERHIDYDIYSNQIIRDNIYPDGTGLAIERMTLMSYITNVLNGKYTLTDRLGSSLSSGGDTQIVLHLLYNKLYVGVSPDLSLYHVIEKRKSNFRYLKKQVYSGCKSFTKAHNEVFKEEGYYLTYKDNWGITKQVIRWILNNFRKVLYPYYLLDFFNLLGKLNSPYFAVSRKPPILLRILIFVFVSDK
jgi:glycosyltransferase involved in cell wall biosynthesis